MNILFATIPFDGHINPLTGIDLRTESPKPGAIARGVARLLSEPQCRVNVARLRDEFSRYHPYELIDAYLSEEQPCPTP